MKTITPLQRNWLFINGEIILQENGGRKTHVNSQEISKLLFSWLLTHHKEVSQATLFSLSVHYHEWLIEVIPRL
jgi:hypothetical protein